MKCSLFFVFLFFLYLKWLIIRVDVKKFKKIFVKCLQISKFCVPLQPQSREMQYKKNEIWCVSSVGQNTCLSRMGSRVRPVRTASQESKIRKSSDSQRN